MINNSMKIQFASVPENEAFARASVASFILPLNPSLSEMSDIKTAVSEGVTNAIVHAYPNENKGEITLFADLDDNSVHIVIEDNGIGITNLEKAREPFFTTKAENDHSGMGFTVMETFMDSFSVISTVGKGTRIEMQKKIGV